jgi:hypothetical protein
VNAGAAIVLIAMEPRAEGWLWWSILVGCIVIVFLIVGVVRRRLVRPMPHTPSDTTDAWREAGRRLAVPPREGPGAPGGGEADEP